jgi:hypothetical protein
MKDLMKYEVLEDGTISIQTGGFGPEVHQSADDFLDALEDMIGGCRTTHKTKTHHVSTSQSTRAQVWHEHA